VIYGALACLSNREQKNLGERNPNNLTHFDSIKEAGKQHLVEQNIELMALQNIIYAEHKQKKY
jgi:hypothetical protein